MKKAPSRPAHRIGQAPVRAAAESALPPAPDHEAADRALAGDTGATRREEAFEALPESQRWDPVPGSTGHQVPEVLPEDEDEEGRSEPELSVEDGIEKAEREQQHQAAQAAKNQERHGG